MKLAVWATTIVLCLVGVLWIAVSVVTNRSMAKQRRVEAATEIALEKFRAAQAEREATWTPQQRRLAAARDIWSDFDDLRGPNFRTKEMLLAYKLRADQVSLGIPETEATEVLAANLVEYRTRLAGLLVLGEPGEVAGPGATTIVPSRDPARCRALLESWKGSGLEHELRSVGFTTFTCPE